MAELSIAAVVGLAGFLAGVAFGATVQRTHFCTMGAIADLVLFGDWRRMRAWLLAMALALMASQALDFLGVIDLAQSPYRTPSLSWLGLALGGLMFGFGMTLTGGCSSRNIVRLGAGNLKSLVVLLVMALVAYATMNGILAMVRQPIEPLGSIDVAARGAADQGLPAILHAATGMPTGLWQGVLSVLLGGALLAFCFKDAAFRQSPKDVAAGLVLGLLIALGWLITGLLGAAGPAPMKLASFTFVAPVADSLIYLLTFPSTPLSFGIATLGGTLVGAFLAAGLAGELRLETFAGRSDFVRHLIGAALMGCGGVLALGCTIGQGMSGLSTLALGSMLAVVAMVGGAIAGVRYLEHGSLVAAARAMVVGWGHQPSSS